jgi:hypothetical protein
MSDTIKTPSAHPLIPIAGACAGASVAIVAIAFFLLHSISDAGMWAIAVMAAAPSGMGVGIAYFMTRTPSQGPPSA